MKKMSFLCILLIATLLFTVGCSPKTISSLTKEPTNPPASEVSEQKTPTPSDQDQIFSVRYCATVGGSITGKTSQQAKYNEKTTAVTAVAQEGYRFAGWSDGLMTENRSGDTVAADTVFTACFVETELLEEVETLPIISIYTTDSNPVTQREYETAVLAVSGAQEQYNTAASLRMKCRGNSTLDMSATQETYESKNSYRLKFDEKVHLLGIGKSGNKDWVLNANKYDVSHLRNDLVWTLAEKMGTIPFVPDHGWAQLYINGAYRGLYMIVEHVEVANDRVDVDEHTDSAEVGFLIETDYSGRDDESCYFFIDDYKIPYVTIGFRIKSNFASTEQYEYIKNYVTACHDAMLSGNQQEIERLIDLDSLIDMFILEELSQDIDCGIMSFFIQKDVGGKLYFTAPWDFDAGFGNHTTTTDGFNCYKCVWFSSLMTQEWFRARVINRMTELDDTFDETIQEVKETATILKNDADKSNLYWDVYGKRYQKWVSKLASETLYSYEEHVDFVVKWAEERWNVIKKDLPKW